MQYIYKLAGGKASHARVFASRSRRNDRRQNNDQRFNLDIFGDEGDGFGTAVVVLVDNTCVQGA